MQFNRNNRVFNYRVAKQKEVQTRKEKANLLECPEILKYYLNRTNRSGIINAEIIGGIEQNGNYLMDCRFNKAELIERIKAIAKEKKEIHYIKDAIKLIDKIQNEELHTMLFLFSTPPYYFLKASTLYMNHYQEDNHKIVSDKIKNIRNIKWIVSYDNVPQIENLCTVLKKNIHLNIRRQFKKWTRNFVFLKQTKTT